MVEHEAFILFFFAEKHQAEPTVRPGEMACTGPLFFFFSVRFFFSFSVTRRTREATPILGTGRPPFKTNAPFVGAGKKEEEEKCFFNPDTPQPQPE
jgi:hypothetical protein